MATVAEISIHTDKCCYCGKSLGHDTSRSRTTLYWIVDCTAVKTKYHELEISYPVCNKCSKKESPLQILSIICILATSIFAIYLLSLGMDNGWYIVSGIVMLVLAPHVGVLMGVLISSLFGLVSFSKKGNQIDIEIMRELKEAGWRDSITRTIMAEPIKKQEFCQLMEHIKNKYDCSIKIYI